MAAEAGFDLKIRVTEFATSLKQSDDGDYQLYRDLLAASCRAAGVEVWSWVLMPNHVHLILKPADADGIRRAAVLVPGRPEPARTAG